MNNFDHWNLLKQERHASERIRYFHERDIFYAYLGKNIGHEQDGKGDAFLRPIIIFRKFNQRLFWGIPLTSKIKKSIFYHSFILNDSRSSAILSQLRLWDSNRLLYKIGKIPPQDFQLLQNKITALMNGDS